MTLADCIAATPLSDSVADVEIDGERPYRNDGVDSDAPPGLGRLAYRSVPSLEVPGKVLWYWWYRAPNRPWTQIFWHGAEPPPLPRPRSQWRFCGCFRNGGQHTCGACGQPYWIEWHGNADGECTYCWYHG